MRTVILSLLLFAGCASGEFQEQDAGIVVDAPVDSFVNYLPWDCEIEGCDTVECLRSLIEECGECRTFYCAEGAISLCQRSCLPPES